MGSIMVYSGVWLVMSVVAAIQFGFVAEGLQRDIGFPVGVGVFAVMLALYGLALLIGSEIKKLAKER